jgi:hypothetical protein
MMEITRPAGAIGIPGHVTDDPGAKKQAAKHGNLSLRLGLGWAKSHSLHTGQTPVLKYHQQLMQAILWESRRRKATSPSTPASPTNSSSIRTGKVPGRPEIGGGRAVVNMVRAHSIDQCAPARNLPADAAESHGEGAFQHVDSIGGAISRS